MKNNKAFGPTFKYNQFCCISKLTNHLRLIIGYAFLSWSLHVSLNNISPVYTITKCDTDNCCLTFTLSSMGMWSDTIPSGWQSSEGESGYFRTNRIINMQILYFRSPTINIHISRGFDLCSLGSWVFLFLHLHCTLSDPYQGPNHLTESIIYLL